MREIKFRAWDGESGRMSKPFHIDELKFGYIKDIDNCVMDKQLILMQYIGLKDKNGKEIYESDIVKLFGRIDYIKWNEYQAKFSTTKAPTGNIANGESIGIEIIGNIYENPELLK